MRQLFVRLLLGLPLFTWGGSLLFAKTAVFWQDGFPTVASQPISRTALTQALGEDAVFVGIDGLRDPSALANADLLVLPYEMCIRDRSCAIDQDGLPECAELPARFSQVPFCGSKVFPEIAEGVRFLL